MAIPIVLYDENHERVGETYHRRAKQLVKSGRAVWLEEGQSLQMSPYPAIELSPAPQSKEDKPMTDGIYTNNGIAPETPTPPEISELRMYIAKQNVARKRNLKRNIVAFALALLILATTSATSVRRVPRQSREAITTTTVMGIDTTGFNQQGRTRRNNQVRLHAFNGLEEHLEAVIIYNLRDNWPGALEQAQLEAWIRPYSFNTAIFETPWHSNGVVNVGVSSNPAHTSPVRVFAMGAMTAWGIWILINAIQITRQNKTTRPKKPDPVALEYQRLSM